MPLDSKPGTLTACGKGDGHSKESEKNDKLEHGEETESTLGQRTRLNST